MNFVKSILYYVWRIAACSFVFAFGLIASRLILHPLGLTPPRLPQQADESIAVYYLLSGSILLSLSLLPFAQKISGAFFTRFLSMFFFFFACFGISVSLESSIYSSIEGFDLMILILLLPIVLFSFTCISLTKSQPTSESFSQKSLRFFKSNTRSEWAWKILLAFLSFPVIYLLFGIIASPLVADYYRESSYGLAIPDIGTIMSVQLVRSLLFLMVTLPIMITWFGNRVQLVVMLGIAHFMFVFSYDIVLAYQLPIKLVLTHAIEILLDSMVYAWVMVKLLYSERSESTSAQIRST